MATASDGQCTATDTVLVHTPFMPTAAFTHTNALCLNNPIHFTDHSTTNGGILAGWDWNFGDGSTSTQQNPTHQYAGPGTYDITLIVLNNLGCLDTITEQLVIDPPPVSQFSASNSCVNTSVAFTDQTSGNVNIWGWNFGDGGTSTAQNPTHVYASAGTYNVTLISGDTLGCIDTIVHPITIYPLPTASAGADQTVCAGGSVTLTASGGSTYVWNPSGSTGSTITISPSGTTTISVTVTDANGCSATDTVSVVVNPLPTISAGADMFICNGSGVTLTASGGVSYTWNPGAHSGATYVVNPGSTTSYTVTGTGANGCTSTDVVQVSVGTLPTANAGPDVDICAGSNTTLTATGGNTYTWNPIGATGSTVVVTPGSTTAYTVIATDAAGCSASDVVNVTVHANPIVNLQSTFLCAGSTTTLDAGNPGSTYIWNTGETTQTIVVNAGGNFDVTVTDAFGCVNSSACTITYGTSMTINLGNVSFCQGDSVTLDAGWPGMNHIWTPGGQTSQTITIATPGNYGVTVTDTSGCSGAMNVTAVMNNLPVVSFSSTSVCIGSTTSFTDGTSVTGGSVASWAWDFGDGSISTAQNPTHTYSAAGTYTVTLTATSATGCVNSTSQTVTVNPLPIPQFTFANGCQGNAIAFTDQSTVSVGLINSYNWNFNDGTTSTSHNPTHTFNTSGNFNVTLQVTTAGRCSQTISHQVVVHPLPVADFSTYSGLSWKRSFFQ
ncbi:MAG: PKD domain-containing protein [Bacteroidetes bacterium]|nr:PKD domain-containing protein [Bacteroidota bacterium]